MKKQPPKTLAELFERYRAKRLINNMPSTCNQYLVSLNWYRKYLGHEPTIADLTDEAVAGFMSWRQKTNRNLSPATVNKNRDNIVALWKFANIHGWTETFPEVKRVREPERAPVAWTREQLSVLWQACRRQQGMIGCVPADLWWHALHAVMWDTGERIAAITKIKWGEVELDSGWLIIRGENRKFRKRDKVHRLHPQTVAVLGEIVAPQRDLVFPWPYSPSYLWTQYTELLKCAGLPFDRKHKFHCMRKSVASYFEAAGHNATELLDHSDRRTTKAYLDEKIVPKVNASEVLFQPDGDGPNTDPPEELPKFIPSTIKFPGRRA